MICSTCAAEGETSRVHPGGTTATLMASYPFYDEQGVYHVHDPNLRRTSYACTRGHSWTESLTARCPAGDYPTPETGAES